MEPFDEVDNGDHSYNRTVEQSRPLKRRKQQKTRDLDPLIYNYWRPTGTREQGSLKKKVYNYQCVFCDYSIVQKKSRQLDHLVNEHGYDTSNDTFEESKVKEVQGMKVQQVSFAGDQYSTGSHRVIVRVDECQLVQSSLDTHFTRFTPKAMEDAQEALSLYQIASGLSFSQFESELWQNFIDKVAKPFKTPSRFQLSTKYLDKHYNAEMEKTLAALREKPAITLGIDEASIAGKKAINFIALVPEPHFIVSKFTGTDQLTAVYLERLTLSVIHDFGLEVKAIVTDNGGGIKQMRERFQNASRQLVAEPTTGQVKSVKCLSVYCLCHGVNLMLQDFMEFEFVKRRVKAASALCHKLNNNTTLRRMYSPFAIRAGLDANKRFNLPPTVRWMYYLDLLKSIIASRVALQDMMRDTEVSSLMRNNEDFEQIKHDEFWEDLIEVSSW